MSDVPVSIPVPFQGRRVEAVLCLPGDFLVLADWCDLVITGDFHFKRRHIESILTRGTSATWAVLVDGVMSGLLILYKGSVLHNMYLAPDVRGLGLGAALLSVFQPERIRSKTNMRSGDPTGFYEANGYAVESVDPLKPHINNMVRVEDGIPLSLVDAAELAATLTADRLQQADQPRPSDATKRPRPPRPPAPPAKPKLTPEERDAHRKEMGRARAKRLREERKTRDVKPDLVVDSAPASAAPAPTASAAATETLAASQGPTESEAISVDAWFASFAFGPYGGG